MTETEAILRAPNAVNVLVAERDGSSFYRLEQPGKAARLSGVDVHVYRWAENPTMWDAATWVVNRPIRAWQADTVERLVDAGKRVIVDMDDDFHHIVPEHSMYGGPGVIQGHNERYHLSHLLRACEVATVVTVTTPSLLETYGFGHGVVIPNHIPARYLAAPKPPQHDGLWVGWFGTISSHPNDLQASQGGVARALKRTGASLALLGDPREGPAIKTRLGIPTSEQAFTSPFCQVHMLPQHINQYDVGIVPLQDCTFNHSKSWLKGLEFAAVGVPFVASPTEDYVRLHDLGAGLLASTRNEWSRHLQELLNDREYRATVAAKGREAALGLTIEGNLDKWLNVWMP